MKRARWIGTAGLAMVVAGYFGFPILFRTLTEQHAQPPLRAVVSPTLGITDPGMLFFRDLDEVRLEYSPSFQPTISVWARRLSYGNGTSEILVTGSIVDSNGPNKEPIKHTEKKITEEVFAELSGYVVRHDVIKRSLVEARPGLDGAMWSLTGKKQGIVLTHVRWCPRSRGDELFITIGRRFVEVAGLPLPEDEIF